MFEFKKNQYYVFHMDAKAKPGLYEMYFEYEAKLASDLKGLYKSVYQRKDGKKVYVLWLIHPCLVVSCCVLMCFK